MTFFKVWSMGIKNIIDVNTINKNIDIKNFPDIKEDIFLETSSLFL
jgi:hypothetical protein